MPIGAKLKQARLEAGLSQRQLCAGVITRNMLSQIENGTARPSMDTLQHFARQLDKPLSWFLEEDALLSANQKIMDAARQAFLAGKAEQVLDILKDYRRPDPCFDPEEALLRAEASLDAAQKAITEDRKVYARQLLEDAREAGAQTPYFRHEQKRRSALLLARLQVSAVRELPSLDEELLLRARAALEEKDHRRAAALLEAAQDHTGADWNCLRGSAAQAAGEYAAAEKWLSQAEQALPDKVIPLLEMCYQQLGDYKKAYEYACKQREKE